MRAQYAHGELDDDALRTIAPRRSRAPVKSNPVAQSNRTADMKNPLLQILLAAGALIAILAIWLASQYVSDSDRVTVVTTLTTVVIFVFGLIASAALGRRKQPSSRKGRRAF